MPVPAGALAGPISIPSPPGDWNRLVIINDAPTRDDIIDDRILAGEPGEALGRLLERGGQTLARTWLTSVFRYQPAWSADTAGRRRTNDIMNFFTHEEEEANKRLPAFRGQHLRELYANDIRALWRSLLDHKPQRVLMLGSVPLWALTGEQAVKPRRASVFTHEQWPGCQLAVTYHPSYAIHSQDDAIMDLIGADLRRLFAAPTAP